MGVWKIICERDIQYSDGGKEKKAELFDLCKKAAVMKQIKIASSALDPNKNCSRRNYKQVRANFWYQNFLMLECSTFLTFQSSS